MQSGEELSFTEHCLDYTVSAEVSLEKLNGKIETVKINNIINNSEAGTAEFKYKLPDLSKYKSVTVTVTNYREGVPDTGVVLDSLPYILILAGVAAVVVLVIVKKNRRRDDD